MSMQDGIRAVQHAFAHAATSSAGRCTSGRHASSCAVRSRASTSASTALPRWSICCAPRARRACSASSAIGRAPCVCSRASTSCPRPQSMDGLPVDIDEDWTSRCRRSSWPTRGGDRSADRRGHRGSGGAARASDGGGRHGRTVDGRRRRGRRRRPAARQRAAPAARPCAQDQGRPSLTQPCAPDAARWRGAAKTAPAARSRKSTNVIGVAAVVRAALYVSESGYLIST